MRASRKQSLKIRFLAAMIDQAREFVSRVSELP
jgi:hypothetical protein